MTIRDLTTFQDKEKIQVLQEQVVQLEMKVQQISRMQVFHEKLTKEKIAFLEKATTNSFTTIIERGFRMMEEEVTGVNDAMQATFTARIAALVEKLGNKRNGTRNGGQNGAQNGR